MIKTLYGHILDSKLKEFCDVAGHELESGEWKIISDEVDYWQLSEAHSTVTERKWKKRPGFLPIRDFNFQYAMYQFKHSDDQVLSAMKYAKEKLFNPQGHPAYLPELLAEKADPMRDQTQKPPKGYGKILQEEKDFGETKP